MFIIFLPLVDFAKVGTSVLTGKSDLAKSLGNFPLSQNKQQK